LKKKAILRKSGVKNFSIFSKTYIFEAKTPMACKKFTELIFFFLKQTNKNEF